MINRDTVKLLGECDSGIKMGMSGIRDMLPYAKSEGMKHILTESGREHERLEAECEAMLRRYGDEGKEPPLIAKGMSKMKTAMKLGLRPTDRTVAGLMHDGCAMGIKSLSGYLNKYEAAEERAKDIAKKLIAMEDKLAEDMRGYL
jgi:uncharacterized protein YaaN involved in tellurite resistance